MIIQTSQVSKPQTESNYEMPICKPTKIIQRAFHLANKKTNKYKQMKSKTILATIILGCTTIYSCDEKKEIEIHKADDHMIQAANSLNVKVDNTIDPICGMKTEGHVSDTIQYEGKIYGFCSTGCKEEFAKSPEQYLSKLN